MHESLGSVPKTTETDCDGARLSFQQIVCHPDPQGAQPGVHETLSQREKKKAGLVATPVHLDRKENPCKFKASLVYTVAGQPELHSEIRSQKKKKGAVEMLQQVHAPKPDNMSSIPKTHC